MYWLNARSNELDIIDDDIVSTLLRLWARAICLKTLISQNAWFFTGHFSTNVSSDTLLYKHDIENAFKLPCSLYSMKKNRRKYYFEALSSVHEVRGKKRKTGWRLC